jgi:hypothetical protein
MGLRFTLSHPVTAAVTPGDPSLFRMALQVHGKIKPLKKTEMQAIKEKGLKGVPLFSFQG